MTPILLQEPALEPVTLAAAKTWLRLDGADEDDLVANLVTAARLIVEAETGKRLISQKWRFVLDAWPDAGVLRLPLAPIQSLDAVRTRNAAGIATALPPSAVLPDLGSDPPRLLAVASPAPWAQQAIAGIEVDVTAGYGASAAAVPPPLRQAILLLVARWYEARGEAGADRALPPEIRPLLWPYRAARL